MKLLYTFLLIISDRFLLGIVKVNCQLADNIYHCLIAIAILF